LDSVVTASVVSCPSRYGLVERVREQRGRDGEHDHHGDVDGSVEGLA
jgi:hypothetical protein